MPGQVNALPKIDMSTSVPLHQPIPDQTASAQTPMALPKIDMSTSMPVDQPTPSAPGTTGVTGALNKVGEFAAGVVPGAVESMGETIQSLPWIGKKIITPEAMQAEREYFRPGSAAEKAGQGTGAIAESALEFVLGDEALKGLALADKIGLASKIAKITTESPYIGKLIQHGVGVARMGTVGTAEALAKGATLPEAVKTGVATGVGGEALSAAAEEAPSAIKTLRGLKNPFRAILEGKAAAQAPAEAAIRGGVTAGVTEPSVAAGVATKPILEGSQTVLDEHLTSLASKEKAAYKAVDDAAGFDVKEANLRLKNDQYKLKQLGNTPEDQTTRVKLINSITDSTKRIDAAEADLKAAGVNPKAADMLHTARMAGMDFKNVIVRTTAPDGTSSVDQLLKQSKMLRFSKRGDRLAQFFGNGDIQAGKPIADKFMIELEAAQKAGMHAMKVQKLAKWVGGLVATGLGIGAGAHAATSLLATEP